SADVMSSCLDCSGTYCLNLVRMFHLAGSTTTLRTFPCRPATRGVRANDIGRTVAISGRCFSQRMVAMRLPPKEGRVACIIRVLGSMANSVASAVMLVLAVRAHREAKERPIVDAGSKSLFGFSC